MPLTLDTTQAQSQKPQALSSLPQTAADDPEGITPVRIEKVLRAKRAMAEGEYDRGHPFNAKLDACFEALLDDLL